MLGVTRYALLGAMMALSTAARAGTPVEEADRCSRYMTALAHADTDAALGIIMERYRPGETPARFIRNQRNEMQGLKSRLVEAGGIKTVEPLPDTVVPATGDIARRQKWTDGKGRISYIGCVISPGENEPWILTVILSGHDDDLNSDLIETATSGKQYTKGGRF